MRCQFCMNHEYPCGQGPEMVLPWIATELALFKCDLEDGCYSLQDVEQARVELIKWVDMMLSHIDL